MKPLKTHIKIFFHQELKFLLQSGIQDENLHEKRSLLSYRGAEISAFLHVMENYAFCQKCH